jgi:hypothetical protein
MAYLRSSYLREAESAPMMNAAVVTELRRELVDNEREDEVRSDGREGQGLERESELAVAFNTEALSGDRGSETSS